MKTELLNMWNVQLTSGKIIFFHNLTPVSSDTETLYKPKVSNPRHRHQNLYNANGLTVLQCLSSKRVPKCYAIYMWPHELVPTPLNYGQLWGAEHLPSSTQRHYSIFCSGKQKIRRRQNNKIGKDEADIKIKFKED